MPVQAAAPRSWGTFASAFPLQNKLFDIGTNMLALTYFSELKHLAFYVPHRIAGIFILPSQISCLPFNNVKEKRNSLKIKLGGEEVFLHTSDGTSIQAMYFLGKECQKSNRTIIFFNPNGVRYEDYTYEKSRLKALQEQGWNIIIFNYRDIITSRCMATCNGLVLDGEAVFDYIKNTLNVPENKILLHGHSLGGGVASEIAANHPFVNYCNDRSFLSLSKQVKVMFGNGIIGSVISKTLSGLGWEYDTIGNWKKIKGIKFVVYHNNDSMIPSRARLHEFLDKGIQTIKLTPGRFQSDKLIGNIDNNEVIDHILKNYKVPIKSKIELMFMKLSTGQIAHMRNYEESELLEYINIINII